MKKKKGFTLIELLIVIAIIGLLAAIVLVSLSTARDKAKVTSYVTYMTQMKRLVADAIAAGYFDDLAIPKACDLGVYGQEPVGTDSCGQLNTELKKLSELPNPGVVSPFNATGKVGLMASPSPADDTHVRVFAIVSGDKIVAKKVCDQAGWMMAPDNSCYIDLRKKAAL